MVGCPIVLVLVILFGGVSVGDASQAQPWGETVYSYDTAGDVAQIPTTEPDGAVVLVADMAGSVLRPGGPIGHLYDSVRSLEAPSGGGSGTLYRGLADGEDPALGLVARNPDANITPSQHVFGTRDSQWISTTRDPAVAAEIYGEHGWVAIDASRVTGPVVDVSGGVPAHVPGHNCMFCNAARAHQEVLIQGAPPGAVTRMIN